MIVRRRFLFVNDNTEERIISFTIIPTFYVSLEKKRMKNCILANPLMNKYE